MLRTWRCITGQPTLSLSMRRQQQRWWSLASLLRPSTQADDFLAAVRINAAASAEWEVDVGALNDHGAALGCPSPPQQSQLVGQVAAALAQVLHTSTSASASASASASVDAAAVRVRSLRWTLTTPAAVDALIALANTTPLLSHVEVVELVIEPGAAGVGQDSMEGGQAVAQLLHLLAAQSAGLPLWKTLAITAQEAAVTSGSHAGGVSLLSTHGGARRLWGDATVAALSSLVQSKAWSSLALLQVDVTACSPRVRQQLWRACAESAAALRELRLTGTQPARECIGSGLLRHLSALTRLDVNHTALAADAVVRLLNDVRESRGGWWRLQQLGLAQCEVDEVVVNTMAAHLREEAGTALAQHTAAMEKDEDGDKMTRDHKRDEEEAALHTLDISGAQLTRTAVFALAGCLLRCSALTHLHTRHCRLQATDVAHIAASLQNATGLHTWTLCRNRIGDEGVAALVKYGKYWPELCELDLTRCRLTAVATQALGRALPAWEKLEVLRLAGNDLRCVAASSNDQGEGTEGTGLFAYDPTYMRAHGTDSKVPTAFELERRDRAEGRRRYRGTEAFREAAAAAAQAQRNASPLETMGESLAFCRSLRVLDLGDAALTDEGLQQLTRAFHEGGGGSSLRELVLASNPLFSTVAGLDALPLLLEHATQLTLLDISFTGLGDLGVSMLCDGTAGTSPGVLTAMSELQTLQLAGCGVQTLGWESLAAVVPLLPALQHLSLNHNAAEEAGVVSDLLEQLAAVGVAPQLRSVQVMGCLADPATLRRLAEGTACVALRRRGVQVCL